MGIKTQLAHITLILNRLLQNIKKCVITEMECKRTIYTIQIAWNLTKSHMTTCNDIILILGWEKNAADNRFMLLLLFSMFEE